MKTLFRKQAQALAFEFWQANREEYAALAENVIAEWLWGLAWRAAVGGFAGGVVLTVLVGLVK